MSASNLRPVLGPVSHGRMVSFTGIRNNQILIFVYSIIEASI